MSDAPSREEIATRLEAVEARVDTKFAQIVGEMRTGFAGLNGRLDGLNGRLDGLNGRLDGVERTTAGLKATIVLTGLGAVALVIAVLAYGQAWFGIGVSTRDVVKAAVSEYLQQHPTPPAK